MADKTFDAVIVGGGNKALLLALYLIKYGGMSVGIFERRHEIGGCLAPRSFRPRFSRNTHANIILPWYYAPIWRDFPSSGTTARNGSSTPAATGSCSGQGELPGDLQREARSDVERTAQEIARFSQRDAETWRKLHKISDRRVHARAHRFAVPAGGGPAHRPVEQRKMMMFPGLLAADLVPVRCP